MSETGEDGEDVSVDAGFDGGVLEGQSWAVLESCLSLHVRAPSRVPTYPRLAACLLQDPNPRQQKASDSTQNSGIWDPQTLSPCLAHGCSYL